MLKTKYYKPKYNEKNPQGEAIAPIPDEVKNQVCVGVMAQDLIGTPLEPIVSRAPRNENIPITDSDDGERWGVNYGDFVPHLIGAVQEIVKQNDRQQSEIEELQQYKKLSEERFDKMGRLIEQLLSKKSPA